MNEKDMQHGQYWQGEDLSGWILTEKFNGCRAYWDGENMWSRGGLKINIPQGWRDEMPTIHLDGEIYCGIDGVYKCGAAIRYGRFLPDMMFIVFDAPREPGRYWDRITSMDKHLSTHNKFIKRAALTICLNNHHAIELMTLIQQSGGEGVMARHPDLAYTPYKTNKLLKVKESLF